MYVIKVEPYSPEELGGAVVALKRGVPSNLPKLLESFFTYSNTELLNFANTGSTELFNRLLGYVWSGNDLMYVISRVIDIDEYTPNPLHSNPDVFLENILKIGVWDKRMFDEVFCSYSYYTLKKAKILINDYTLDNIFKAVFPEYGIEYIYDKLFLSLTNKLPETSRRSFVVQELTKYCAQHCYIANAIDEEHRAYTITHHLFQRHKPAFLYFLKRSSKDTAQILRYLIINDTLLPDDVEANKKALLDIDIVPKFGVDLSEFGGHKNVYDCWKYYVDNKSLF